MGEPDTRHTPSSLRARLGLTQQQVADRANVHARTIRNLEDGKSLSLDNLRAIATALGVADQDLIAAIDVERERRAASKRRRKAGAA